MQEYGKILDGSLSCSCNTYEFYSVIDLKRAEECPDGYLPIQKDANKPEVPQGKWLAFIYTNEGTYLRKQYFLVDEGQSAINLVKTYSKLKCVLELTKAGVWETVKKWIEDNGLYDLYLAAQEFADDNEYFLKGKAEIAATLGWTDEQIDEFLDKCIKD